MAFLVDAFDGLIRVGQEAFLFGQTAIAQMDAFANKDFARVKALGQAWKKEKTFSMRLCSLRRSSKNSRS